MAEQDDRAPRRPLSLRSPWTVAWLGLAVTVPVALWTLLPDAGSVSIPLVVAVLVGLVAAESFTVHFEFRKQGFTWSPSELAFVMALVAVGGPWTAIARAVAVGAIVVRQGSSRPKAAFNISVAVLEVCAAVAILRGPAGRLDLLARDVAVLPRGRRRGQPARGRLHRRRHHR